MLLKTCVQGIGHFMDKIVSNCYQRSRTEKYTYIYILKSESILSFNLEAYSFKKLS